jgi:hypothetical protein
MKTRLENLIISLKFTEAKALVDGMTKDEFECSILELCYKSENILCYSFVLDLLKSKETAFLHYIASIILSHPLCHLQGAYQAAYYHAKKAVEFDEDDVELKEYLLFFNDIPDKLLSNQEAKTLAEQILSLKPKSEVAKQYI